MYSWDSNTFSELLASSLIYNCKNCVIYQILHSKKLFWGTLEFVLTWVCSKYDWPPLTFGIVELLKIIFHFFEVFCTVTFVWFRLFHGNNKECLNSFGLVGIGWVLAQSTFWLWAFYFCGLNFPKKMRKKKINILRQTKFLFVTTTKTPTICFLLLVFWFKIMLLCPFHLSLGKSNFPNKEKMNFSDGGNEEFPKGRIGELPH